MIWLFFASAFAAASGQHLPSPTPRVLDISQQVVSTSHGEVLLERFRIDARVNAKVQHCPAPTLDQWARAAQEEGFVASPMLEDVVATDPNLLCGQPQHYSLDANLRGSGVIIEAGPGGTIQRRIDVAGMNRAPHRCTQTFPTPSTSLYVQTSKLNLRSARDPNSSRVTTLQIAAPVWGRKGVDDASGWVFVQAQSKVDSCNKVQEVTGWAPEELLGPNPPNAWELHSQGVADLNEGRANEAVPLLERAAALADLGEFLDDLQRAYRAAGMLAEADALAQRRGPTPSQGAAGPDITYLLPLDGDKGCAWMRTVGNDAPVTLLHLSTPCSRVLQGTLAENEGRALAATGSLAAFELHFADLHDPNRAMPLSPLPAAFLPPKAELFAARLFNGEPQVFVVFPSPADAHHQQDGTWPTLKELVYTDGNWEEGVTIKQTSDSHETDVLPRELTEGYRHRARMRQKVLWERSESKKCKTGLRAVTGGEVVLCTQEGEEWWESFTGQVVVQRHGAKPKTVTVQALKDMDLGDLEGVQIQGSYFKVCRGAQKGRDFDILKELHTFTASGIIDLTTGHAVKTPPGASLWPFDLCTRYTPLRPD